MFYPQWDLGVYSLLKTNMFIGIPIYIYIILWIYWMRIADTFHNGDVVVMRDYQYQRVSCPNVSLLFHPRLICSWVPIIFHCLILKSVSLYTIKGHHIPGIVVDPQT